MSSAASRRRSPRRPSAGARAGSTWNAQIIPICRWATIAGHAAATASRRAAIAATRAGKPGNSSRSSPTPASAAAQVIGLAVKVWLCRKLRAGAPVNASSKPLRISTAASGSTPARPLLRHRKSGVTPAHCDANA